MRTGCGSPLLDSGPIPPQSGEQQPYLGLLKLQKARGRGRPCMIEAFSWLQNVQPALSPNSTKSWENLMFLGIPVIYALEGDKG